ncbi:MAG: TolC family protein [Congregibacter sp.]
MLPNRRFKAETQAVFYLLSLVVAVGANAQVVLTLNEAESLALDTEPGREAILARADSLAERSVIAGQLPDPQFRIGAVNFPIESGGFTTEGMTQAQLGVRQAFPAGKTRSLGSERYLELERQMQRIASAREREVLMRVRQTWITVYYWQQAHTIVTDSRRYFEDLVTVTSSLYSLGSRDQQDLLQAELELSRLDDRLLGINKSLAQARAMLSEWVGTAASLSVGTSLPIWAQPPSLSTLIEDLSEHPRLLAAQSLVSAQRTGVELAEQQYKPDWAIDVGYGYRDGALPTGEARSDFLSVMVTVDVPLFRDKRQDRVVAAARKERYAASQELEQLRRQLESELRGAYGRWEDLNRQVELYQRTIVPQADDRAEAALLAYQSENSDFDDVMRGQIDVLDIRVQLERLKAERAQSHAVLANLGGISP